MGLHQGVKCWKREKREPSSVVLCTECVCWGGGREGLLQATSFPSISVVGPLQSSGCPAPTQFPLRTYQEHEDDGALVDVVHQVTRLLAKPAPAKTGWCKWPAEPEPGTTAALKPGSSGLILSETPSPWLLLPLKPGWTAPDPLTSFGHS